MSRDRLLLAYAGVVGTIGWVWLLASGPSFAQPAMLVLFIALALAIEGTRLRILPSDPHSLVGVALLTAAFVLGAPAGALVAAISGVLFGVLQPLVYARPFGWFVSVGRPFLRGGVRAIGVLSGYALAVGATGSPPDKVTWYILACICYPLVIQLNRVAREYIQGGRDGVLSWWRTARRWVLTTEIAPLPTAWLGAAIYFQLGLGYFLIACGLLIATSITVRRASVNIQRQRRSVRELALLNQVSRAIIRSGLDVKALCDLIYTETSKLVDTSSFHLGLFEPQSNQYTLMVRVQDRVRQPPLISEVEAGDGIIGWMRATGRSLLVHDFVREMDELPARPRYQSERPPRSGIYVPLIVDDVVIGTISIQSYIPNAFEASDLRLLSLIADQAAVAIAKARTFAEAQQRANQLQTIHEVSQRITAILDLDELLQSVVQLIRERFVYHPVHIFTLEDDGRLVFRASTIDEPDTDILRIDELRLGFGLVGTAAAEGRPLLVNDVAADSRYVRDNPDTNSELVIPLRFADETVGVLDVQSSQLGRFSDSDLFVMQTLAGQIAVAIESARAYTAQREEAWVLNALLQVAENTAWAESLDELLLAIVRLPPLLLGCDCCYCLVCEPGELSNGAEASMTRVRALAAYGLPHEQRQRFVGAAFPLDQAPLIAQTLESQEQITVSGGNLAGFGPVIQSLGGGALLAAPLTARGLPLGILMLVYADPAMAFDERTLTLATGMSGLVAGALESALLAQSAAEAARLDQELRVAREIQTTLLPAQFPQIPGWEVVADWRSARLVGGDFYDFWWLPTRVEQPDMREGRISRAVNGPPEPLQPAIPGSHNVAGTARPRQLGFVIADVSDKGVPAAMFMTLSRSLMRAAALDGSSPAAALERANRWITRDSDSGMFVTLFYAVLEPASGELRYSCAGHNPPLLVRAADGATLELTTHDMALGVLEELELHEAVVTLHPGDMVVCYTDGITEAIDADEQPFGTERLIDVVVQHRQQSAANVLAAITAELTAFVGDSQPFDDLTMVVVKRDEASRFDDMLGVDRAAGASFAA